MIEYTWNYSVEYIRIILNKVYLIILKIIYYLIRYISKDDSFYNITYSYISNYSIANIMSCYVLVISLILLNKRNTIKQDVKQYQS